MRVVAMPETEATEKLEFEEIFNAHSRFVYRTAYAVTGRHEDAEDVLQTIFLRLAKREITLDLLRNIQSLRWRRAGWMPRHSAARCFSHYCKAGFD